MSGAVPAAVVEHVRTNAGRLLGLEDPLDAEVVVASEGTRVRARLHRLEVRARGRALRLVLKETSLDEAPEAVGTSDRPRLTVPADTHERHLHEYRGLAAAQEHFAHLDDARFTVVRVFAHFPAERAFLAEDVPWPTLRELLAGPARVTSRSRIARALGNAGAWLREFHSLPAPTDEPPLRESPDRLIQALREQARFVEAHGGGDLVRTAADRAAQYAAGLSWPVGLWHGDFAPRNVFVDERGAVAGFDMAARRRAPVHEDIAFFLMSLRGGGARRLTGLLPRGRTGRSRHGAAFLRGYFGAEPLPERELAVFGLLVTLDDWARLAAERTPGPIELRALRNEVRALSARLERR